MEKTIEEILCSLVRKNYPNEYEIFSVYSNSMIKKYKKQTKYLTASDKTEFGVTEILVSEILVAILVTICSEIIKDGYKVTKQKIFEYLKSKKEQATYTEKKLNNSTHLTIILHKEIKNLISNDKPEIEAK